MFVAKGPRYEFRGGGVKYLIDAQDRRNVGDYSIRVAVSKEQAEEMLDWIKEFLQAAEKYLSQAF
jgi:uncharacterized protein (UPF0332 family)